MLFGMLRLTASLQKVGKAEKQKVDINPFWTQKDGIIAESRKSRKAESGH
jgi:hypothetical protein